MALVLIDRSQESATANTTVSFTLNGAQTGYQSLAGVGDTNTTYYGATDGTNWEVGIGTYSTTGPTLTRTTILSSSNSNAAVSTFTSPLTVWVDYTASKAVTTDTLAYPPAIGATTPAAGTFTTITGQTEVLKGTGQNLVAQSNAFTTTWSTTAATAATTVATTDPFGGTSAWTLTEDSTTSGHFLQQGPSVQSGVTYTLSAYLKANTRTCAQLILTGTSNAIAGFDLSAGTTVGASTGSATITSIGNGWYRCSVTVAATTQGAISLQIRVAQTSSTTASSYLGNGTSNIYVYGAQLEIGSVANTYIPTTTTVVYGTPSLSFSGVAGLGLQSDGSLYLQPAGTGALQAQATTSSAVGGNARGANAVDWQTLRNTATQVASQYASTIAGGAQNTAGGYNSTTVGGSNNSSGQFGFTGGGTNNSSAGSQYATVVAGQANTGVGYHNFIGGGFTNSGTSGSAVTTQATTIAVTASTTLYLTSTNANIKVGQLIQATGVTNFTYATSTVTTGTAAVMNTSTISGTTLTVGYLASGTIIAGQVLTGTGVTAGT